MSLKEIDHGKAAELEDLALNGKSSKGKLESR